MTPRQPESKAMRRLRAVFTSIGLGALNLCVGAVMFLAGAFVMVGLVIVFDVIVALVDALTP